ncbi:MAG: hypothetical protein A2493_01085 [Candidatus Magasanikbacteria bacterium RIFOXYC12_FULL_33_11]|uniref:Uncharacterized protein n=1 Tax=Candidatus Magasanikbacteria bacterium RIFOXYC12_FULL_33_11 TaxID=1798701 RepID=A0A1F6NS58_9BACT|nr:MAG: hypothetical protein A2493_01085 [Candidatus Magasanikbacteria bacterium RIFOXYC12_FULL_33_11]
MLFRFIRTSTLQKIVLVEFFVGRGFLFLFLRYRNPHSDRIILFGFYFPGGKESAVIRNFRFLSTLVLMAFFVLVSACRSGEEDTFNKELLSNSATVVKQPKPQWGGAKEDRGQWGESSKSEMVECPLDHNNRFNKHWDMVSSDTCLARVRHSSPSYLKLQQENDERVKLEAQQKTHEEQEKARRIEERKVLVERLKTCFDKEDSRPQWRQDVESGLRAKDVLLEVQYDDYVDGKVYPCYDDARLCMKDVEGCELVEQSKKYNLERDKNFVALIWKILNFKDEIAPRQFCWDGCSVFSRGDLARKTMVVMENYGWTPEDFGFKSEDLIVAIKRSYQETFKYATQDIEVVFKCKRDDQDGVFLDEDCQFLETEQAEALSSLCGEFLRDASFSGLTSEQIIKLHCEGVDD